MTTTLESASYTEGGDPVAIQPNLTVTDVNDNIESGVVKIATSDFQVEDELVFADQNGITGDYDENTGVLTLTGSSSVANYEAALRTIAYRHNGTEPSQIKGITFKVNDGDVDSNEAQGSVAVTSTP